MNPAPTYDRDVLDLLDRAGIPTTCPPILLPEQVERVLNMNTDQRRALEKAGMLTPSGRTPGGHARYSPADLAHAILTLALRAYWHQLDPDEPTPD